MKPFYVTTPIYYVNDQPHVGHAYSTVAADVLARFAKLGGRPTYFLAGVDEHGQKIERAAELANVTPLALADQMAPKFRDAWVDLGCINDDFIRTSEQRHQTLAVEFWKTIQARGDIYLGDYEDWYCVGCESFKTEKELLPGNLCPDHKKPVERVKEQSYFFRLSNYTQPLLDFYEAHPKFVQPEGRFNEVKAFVREGLRDLSVSRSTVRWGIPVPGDSRHVMYVWMDALANYISALGGPAAPGTAPLYDQFWNGGGEQVHIVGKDILRFHAIFWPAFLLSAGIQPPTRIEAHGWLTVNGEKMSKSLGNFLPPRPLIDAFGADVLRYYLMREIGFGQDGDFSHANLIARYNGELGNGLGNLLNRVVASIVKTHFDSRVPVFSPDTLNDDDNKLIATAKRCAELSAKNIEDIAPHRALDAIFELVTATNKYVDSTAPWALAKKGEIERLGQVSYSVLEALRWLSIMLWPFMPKKCDELRKQLGLGALAPSVGVNVWPNAWGELPAGTLTAPAAPLFPRIDKDAEQAIFEKLGLSTGATAKAAPVPKTQKAPKPAATETASPTADSAPSELITFDDFAKVKLKLARVLSAERVPKSDKLLKLMVEVGEETPRQILAGIGQHYTPEDLIGRSVVVVANLAPRKMMGQESQGMVLAASDADALSVLFVEKPIAPGSPVK